MIGLQTEIEEDDPRDLPISNHEINVEELNYAKDKLANLSFEMPPSYKTSANILQKATSNFPYVSSLASQNDGNLAAAIEVNHMNIEKFLRITDASVKEKYTKLENELKNIDIKADKIIKKTAKADKINKKLSNVIRTIAHKPDVRTPVRKVKKKRVITVIPPIKHERVITAISSIKRSEGDMKYPFGLLKIEVVKRE